MKLTREEAIRLHRELWGWLAENPMKQKTDYPKFKERVTNYCYLCEFAGSECAKCPVEWPKTRSASPCHCMESYFGEWNDAKLPEERSRLAALIRDLPEKFAVGDRVKVREDLEVDSRYDDGCRFTADMEKYRGKTGVITKDYSGGRFRLDIDGSRWCWSPSMLEPAEPPKPKPRFSVGDKVVPVSKTVPGFARDIATDIYWRRSQERGYFFVVGINEHETKENGDRTVYFYCCNADETESCGSFYFESDLRPYVEPKPEPEFKRGDKVVPIGISEGGWTLENYKNYPTKIPNFLRENGYLCVNELKNGKYLCGTDNLRGQDEFYPSELIPYVEPIPPINHCPENKTVVIDNDGNRHIFNGPVTVLVGRLCDE